MRMSGVRLIAMDVDGTLVDRYNRISPANLEAIRAARQRGIIAAIATGRIPAVMHDIMHAHGISCPVVGINGTYVTDERCGTICEHFLPRDSALQALRILADMQIRFAINARGVVCESTEERSYSVDPSFLGRLKQFGVQVMFGLDSAFRCMEEKPVYKIIASSREKIQAVRDALAEIPGLSLSRSWYDNVEIMPEGIDKGTGVKALADHYGVPMEDVMALGDELNDLPMIKAAGWGIAMGNADESVKKSARFITDDYEADGVAKAIRRYALQDDSCGGLRFSGE